MTDGAVAYARVVVDTNVILSAALSPSGAPSLLVSRLVIESRLVFSEPTFAELETRLWKPKFDRYVSMTRRRELLHDLRAIADWVEVPPSVAERRYSRDATDDKFIHAALAGEAMRLISGDEDLLTLSRIDGERLQIVSPRQALDELGIERVSPASR